MDFLFFVWANNQNNEKDASQFEIKNDLGDSFLPNFS